MKKVWKTTESLAKKIPLPINWKYNKKIAAALIFIHFWGACFKALVWVLLGSCSSLQVFSFQSCIARKNTTIGYGVQLPFSSTFCWPGWQVEHANVWSSCLMRFVPNRRRGKEPLAIHKKEPRFLSLPLHWLYSVMITESTWMSTGYSLSVFQVMCLLAFSQLSPPAWWRGCRPVHLPAAGGVTCVTAMLFSLIRESANKLPPKHPQPPLFFLL